MEGNELLAASNKLLVSIYVMLVLCDLKDRSKYMVWTFFERHVVLESG